MSSCTPVTFDCDGHHKKYNDSRNGAGIFQANLFYKETIEAVVGTGSPERDGPATNVWKSL